MILLKFSSSTKAKTYEKKTDQIEILQKTNIHKGPVFDE